MPDQEEDQGAPQPAEAAPARQLPRNVPTLTQVVGSEAPGSTSDAAAEVASNPAQGTAAVLPDAQAVLALLGPDLDRLISEAIGRVLHEQMLGLNGRVQKAVAEVVRDAVATAHTRSAHGSDVRKNP